MFKHSNLKIYRKFLILVVLLGGLFFTSALNQAQASDDFCCSVCDVPHMECVADCNANYPNPGPARTACLRNCFDDLYWCMQQGVCDPGC